MKEEENKITNQLVRYVSVRFFQIQLLYTLDPQTPSHYTSSMPVFHPLPASPSLQKNKKPKRIDPRADQIQHDGEDIFFPKETRLHERHVVDSER